MSSPDQREWGEQPLHDWMEQRQLDNHRLVACSDEQLTHKQLARARRGRWLTASMRAKILRAAQHWQRRHEPEAAALREGDLFNYAKAPSPPTHV